MQPNRKKKKNHARCNKMCRPLSQTKILHCPQCIKAKINSSIKGRSYLKHLIYIYFFYFEISFTPANVSSQKKNNNKTKNINKNKNKRRKEKKRKNRKKRKLKQIWHNFIRLFQSSRSIPIGRDLQ